MILLLIEAVTEWLVGFPSSFRKYKGYCNRDRIVMMCILWEIVNVDITHHCLKGKQAGTEYRREGKVSDNQYSISKGFL